MKNADLPAMPIASDDQASGIFEGSVRAAKLAGLTKRELISAMALQGLMANSNSQIAFHSQDGKTMAMAAIANADALLAGLE